LEHSPFFACDLSPNIYVGPDKNKSPLEELKVERYMNTTNNKLFSSIPEIWEEEETGLAKFFETLPSNYPIQSVITNGTEYYVTKFINYEQDKKVVYFAVEDKVVPLQCGEIDGIILSKSHNFD
jgi:hypothetical protein